MGRIKSTLVKRTAKTLIKHIEFKDSFNGNKKILGGNTMPSKRMRNKIAGYMTRLQQMKMEAAQKLREQMASA